MTLILLGIFSATWIGLASAEEVEIELYVHTDKAFYRYGEEGTLYVTVWNKGGAVTLKNIEVQFPWEGPHLWNFTTLEIGEAIGKEKKTYEITFGVPSESRDVWTDNKAQVTLNYEALETSEKITRSIEIKVAMPVYSENIMPIYYLTAVLTIAVIIVIIELYFVWKRLGKLTPVSTTA